MENMLLGEDAAPAKDHCGSVDEDDFLGLK